MVGGTGTSATGETEATGAGGLGEQRIDQPQEWARSIGLRPGGPLARAIRPHKTQATHYLLVLAAHARRGLRYGVVTRAPTARPRAVRRQATAIVEERAV